jgi:23S rRNA (uracil1939-C5)-methyltransferase
MKPSQDLLGDPATFEVEIEKLVYGGEGLGRHEGKVVFVPFTAPGDLVEVRPVKRKKGYIRAVVTRILKPGPGRQDPPCLHFGSCGGCQWQHMDYALQIETKRRILEEGFHHRLPASRELRISMNPCPQPYGYRSRARLQLRGTNPRPAVGFFRHRSHAVEDVTMCPLFRPALNEVLTIVRTAHCEGRYGSSEKEVEIACADDGSWACVETGPTPDPAVDIEDILSRRIGDFVYAAAASVFFQANDFMLSELLTAVMELAIGRDSALDLYSGVGFFTLPLAQRFREVVAVESNRSAHQLCDRNAANAGLNNIRTVCADVENWMRAMGSIAAPAFDLILLDPPRSGAGPEVMKCLTEWAPETIVYVSCDPQTLIRDLVMLPASDYRIDSIAGFDLFPQTYHFETVVRLRRQ